MSAIQPSLASRKNALRRYRRVGPEVSLGTLSVLLLAGCASVGPQEAFQAVQNNVAAASGYRVTWNQGTADDEKAETEVHRLLQSPLGVNEAVQIALLNNSDLQATFEEVGISQADLVQAGLLRNPTFAASLRFPDVPPGITDAEYSIAEDFLSVALIPLKTKVAGANLTADENRITQQVIHLIGDVKTTFYTYQAQLQLGGRLHQIVDANQAGAELAKAQHDAGNLSDAAFLNQQTPVADARMALSGAEKEEIGTREKLNRLMGLSDEEMAWTARPTLPNLPGHDPGLAGLETRAVAQRRDLLAARQEVDAIGQALALKTNTRFLPVSINIGADTEETPDRQRVTGPTLEVELPIFDQGQGDVARLAAQEGQARRRLQSLVVQIRSEVREAWNLLKIDRDQIAYFRQVVLPLDIKSVNKTLLQYNAMEVNTYELLMAKQRELDTEQEFVGAWRDYWISRSQLEEAVGGNLRAATPTPTK
jgi:cobalt-zinc-cadmium efflux system outer membrane protein